MATRALTYAVVPTAAQIDALRKMHSGCVAVRNALLQQRQEARARLTVDPARVIQVTRSACCGARLRDGKCRCRGCGQAGCQAEEGRRCGQSEIAAIMGDAVQAREEAVVAARLLLGSGNLCGRCLRPCKVVAVCAGCGGALRRPQKALGDVGGPNTWTCPACGPRAKAQPDSARSDCHGASVEGQSRGLTELRKQAADGSLNVRTGRRRSIGVHQIPTGMVRGALERLDKAMDAHLDPGRRAGAPRFVSARSPVSLDWQIQAEEDKSPLVLDGRAAQRLAEGRAAWATFHVPGVPAPGAPEVGGLRVRLHRPQEGQIKHAVLRETPEGRWELTVQCDDVPGRIASPAEREVGVDLGWSGGVLAVLSDGAEVGNPAPLNRALPLLRRRQRKLSRKHEQRKATQTLQGLYRERKKERERERPNLFRLAALEARIVRAEAGELGRAPRSKRAQEARLSVAKVHGGIGRRRKDFAHKLSSALVYGGRLDDGARIEPAAKIAIEKMNLRRMAETTHLDPDVRDPVALNRGNADAGWGQIVQMVQAKAADAGRVCAPIPAERDQKRGGRRESAKRILAAGQAIWHGPEDGSPPANGGRSKKSSPQTPSRRGRRTGSAALGTLPGSPGAGDGSSLQAGTPPRAEGIGSTAGFAPSASAPVEVPTTKIVHDRIREQ